MTNYGRVLPFGDASLPSNYSQPSFVGPYGFFSGIASTNSGGFWLVNAYGDVYAYGNAQYVAGGGNLGGTIVGIAAVSASGYWLVNNNGAVDAWDVSYEGAPSGVSNIIGISPTDDGGGYWEGPSITDSGNNFFAEGDATTAFNFGPPIIPPPPAQSQPAADTLGSGNPASVYHSPCSGGPVNCESGNLWETYTDASIPGRGIALDLARTYNSLAGNVLGPFGYGWTDSYNTSLAINSQTVTVNFDDGSSLTFAVDGTSYVGPTWADATLTSIGSSYSLVMSRATTFTFSNAANSSVGQLVSMTDLNGYTTTLSYSGTELSTVTDPEGRTLTFNYNPAGLVSSVTDPDNQTETQYGYNGSDELTSVTDPKQNVTHFGYQEVGSPAYHLLHQITTPDGGATQIGYVTTGGSTTGQTQSIENAIDQTTTYSYAGTFTSSGSTTVTSWDGSQTELQFSDGTMTSETTAYGTAQAATTTFGYDPATMGVTETTDPNGNHTEETYDQYGNVIDSTDANGNTTTTTYNQFNEPLTVTGPTGIETQYIYDLKGNKTEEEVDPSPGGVTGSNDWSSSNMGTEIATELVQASCPSASLCVASDDQGNILTSTDPSSASDWNVASVDKPGTTLRVSCPSATLCIAVDSLGNVLWSSNPTGGSSAWSTLSVDNAQPISAITCPTTTLCVAVDGAGNVLTSTSPGGGAGSWTVSNVSSDSLWSVSCASRSLCAVGTANGYVLSSTTPTGGAASWSANHADRTFGVTSMSCPTIHLCVAGDIAGGVITTTTPTTGSWTRTAVDTSEFGVSCVSTSFCVGADYQGNIFTTTSPTSGGSWTEASGVDSSGLNSVTCVSTTWCVAPDATGGISVSTNPTGGKKNWATEGGLDAPTDYDPVDDMFCPASGFCVGSDALGNTLVSGAPESGASSFVKLDVSGYSISSLTCVPTQVIGAIPQCYGSDLGGHFLDPNEADFETTSGWTSTEIDTSDPLSGREQLYGLSCPSASLCVASDNGAVLVSTNPTGGASAWTTYDVDGTTPIVGMSCLSTTECVGVDANGRVISSTNPTGGASAWTVAALPGFPAGATVTSLSCADVINCIAAGSDGETYYSLGDPTNISNWEAFHVDGTATISDVSCAQYQIYGAMCMAVDSNGNALSSTSPNTGDWALADVDSNTPITAVSCAALDYSTFSQCFVGDTDGNFLIYNPQPEITTYEYHDSYAGELTEAGDSLDRATDYTYDSYGDVATATSYPTPGQTDTVQDVYDILGRKVCEASAVAYAHGTRCPAAGQPRVSNTTTWAYDADSNISSVTDPDGNQTQYTYDDDGNKLTSKDQLSNVNKTTYDALDRPTSTTTGYGSSVASTTTQSYEVPAGTAPCSSSVTGAIYCNVTTNDLGQSTVSYFDLRGDNIETVAPGNITTTSTYDGMGNVLSQTSPAGTATEHYDSDYNVTGVTYSNAQAGFAASPDVSYTYNQDNQRTSMTDGTGTTSYVYDDFGRPISVTNGANQNVQYAYDLDNEVTKITYPNGKSVNQGYNGSGQMTSVSDFQGRTTTFAYQLTSPLNANGGQVATSLPTNQTIDTVSDAAGAETNVEMSPWATANSDGSNVGKAVSCPAANLCVEGDASGNIVTSASPISGSGSWSVANIDGTTAIDAISCPSTSLCIAGDAAGHVFTSTDPTGGSTQWTKTKIDGSNAITSLSCPTTSLCVATDGAGNILTSTAPTTASWSSAVNVDSSALNSLACPSSNLCVAVDAAGRAITATSPTGGSSAWTKGRIDGTTSINSVACPSKTLCVAVDGAGNALTTTTPTGGSGAWAQTDFDGTTAVEGLSCPSISMCVASDASGSVFTTDAPGGAAGAWSVSQIDSGPISSIACAGIALCVAADSNGNVLTATNLQTPNWNSDSVDGSIAVNAISCQSAGALCIAGDNSGNIITSTSSSAGPSAWTSANVDGATALESVACPSSTLCLAGDSSGGVLTSTNPTGGTSAWSRASGPGVEVTDGLCG